MFVRLRSFSLLGCLLTTVAIAENPLLSDDYSQAKHETRKAMRGEWKIENGVASVTQDDELYKRHKNHGPIMVYGIEHDDASAEVTFKPNGCKTVVFTMDAKNGGHAFRVRMSTKTPGTVVTYNREPGKEKATLIVLDRTLPKLKENEWNTLKLKVIGNKGTVMLGDAKVDVQHEKIDEEKKIAKLGFSFGSLQIKQFNLSAVK